MNDVAELVVTCGSWQEAQRIADKLLERQLIASAELLAAGPSTIKLVITALAARFAAIEQELARLPHHRGETAYLPVRDGD